MFSKFLLLSVFLLGLSEIANADTIPFQGLGQTNCFVSCNFTSPTINGAIIGNGGNQLFTSGNHALFDETGTVAPGSASTAINVSFAGEETYAGSAALSLPGHIIGVLGHFTDTAPNSNTLPLAIGSECKVENDGNGSTSGNITNLESCNAQLASNSGILSNWYGVYADLVSNTGTVSLAAFHSCQNDANTGTITNEICYYVPTITAVTASTVLTGFYFGSQGGFTTKYSFYDADATAKLYNSGATVLAGITTDSTHTDATVCEDTTTHQLYFGSGTSGVCLGTSSKRFKRDIQAFVPGLGALMKLAPVNYRYKQGYGDNGATVQYGLIAEDVATVLPTLVHDDIKGKPESVDYLGIIPVLVKSLQEEQDEIDILFGLVILLGIYCIYLHRKINYALDF